MLHVTEYVCSDDSVALLTPCEAKKHQKLFNFVQKSQTDNTVHVIKSLT